MPRGKEKKKVQEFVRVFLKSLNLEGVGSQGLLISINASELLVNFRLDLNKEPVKSHVNQFQLWNYIKYGHQTK